MLTPEQEKDNIRKRKLEEAQREEKDRQMIEEQIRIPGRQVIDSRGRKWIQCEICGKIAEEKEFWSYQWNRGKCKECGTSQLESTTEEKLSHEKKIVRKDDECPWCGEKLVKRNGKNGPFLGCSSYPRCRYTRSV